MNYQELFKNNIFPKYGNLRDLENDNLLLNNKLLEKSVNFLMLKNSVLRTNIIIKNNISTLKINNNSFKLKIYNNVNMEKKIEELKNQVFDLEKDLLFNITYFNNEKKQQLLLCFSDIIIDGKSIYTFFKELHIIYTSLLNNNVPKIESKNYYSLINSTQIANFNTFYKIGGYINTFPIEKKNYTNTEARISYIFPDKYFLKIKNYININKLTLFQFFQSIIFIILYKYTKNDNLIIDTIMDTGISKIIGLFNNTVIIPCNNFNEKETVTTFLKKNKQVSKYLLDNRKILLEKICSALKINELPIIRLHFEFKYKEKFEFDFGKWQGHANLIENNANTIRQLIIFNYANYNNHLESYISYKKDCFSENAVKEMRSNMFIIIDKIIHNSDISLKELLDSMEIKTEFNHLYKPKVDYRLLAYKTAGKYPDINYQNFKEKLDTLFSNKD